MFYEKRADRANHLFFSNYTPEKYMKGSALPHFHNSIEIFIVERGKYVIHTSGKHQILHAGDIAFIDSFTPHTSDIMDPDEDFSVYVIVANAKYFSSVDWLHENTLAQFTKNKEGFDNILDVVKSVYAISGKLNENAKEGFVTLLLGLLYSYTEVLPKNKDKRSTMIVEIMKYIGENYAEEITLERLSAKFGYEKTYISDSINKAINMSLREYINRLRISEVKRSIANNPEEPLYIIAKRCGYTCQRTFYRALKRYGEE